MPRPPKPVTVSDVYLHDILLELRALRHELKQDGMSDEQMLDRMQRVHGIGPAKADEILLQIKEG